MYTGRMIDDLQKMVERAMTPREQVYELMWQFSNRAQEDADRKLDDSNKFLDAAERMI